MISIEKLLPHSGNMVLIDEIKNHSETNIVCTTQSHQLETNPLRTPRGLPISAGLEYGSQAIAIHAAINRNHDNAPKQARIIALKSAQWNQDWLHTLQSELIIQAEIKTKLETLAQYSFRIFSKDTTKSIYSAEVSLALIS